MRNLNENVYRMDADQTYKIYANFVNLPLQTIMQYFEDVSELEGKLPEGRFTKDLSPREEQILAGLSGSNKRCYEKQLLLEIKKRLLKSGLGTKLRAMSYEEIADCRKVALAEAIERLVPGFIPKTVSVEEAKMVTPTPMGGQPPRGRRHP